MKYTDIKATLNSYLEEKYKNIKIYGKDVAEGYITPCFFTSVISFPETQSNKNFVSSGFTYKIAYFQSVKDEVDQLEKLDEIYDLFEKSIVIKDRTLLIKEKDFEYIGEKSDILEISIKCEYLENRYIPPLEEVADNLELNIKEVYNK